MRWQSLLLIACVLAIFTVAQADNVNTSWAGTNVLKMPRINPVIDSRLNGELSVKPQSELIPVWIFFTDKGLESQDSYNSALSSFEWNMTTAARERRMKTRGKNNLADFRDLPLSENYISQVLATGAHLRQTLRWFNAVTVNATKDQISEIADLSFVRYVKEVAFCRSSHDAQLSPLPQNSELVTLDYGYSTGQINQINVVPAHELGFKGQDVIVCMMDVGFKQAHIAFQNIINSGRLLAQYDFINHDYNTDLESGDPSGQADHGTLTWSTLGGESSGHLYGPSYMASFVLAKTEDVSSERHIEEDNWAAGAEWADSIGASVISSSLGYRAFDSGQGDYQYSDLNGHTAIVTQAAQLAALNGITVCNAMGNEGNYTGSLIAPADADSILSCGAVDGSGYLAGFSSWGPTYDGRIKPEVCAQGVSTACADPYNMNGFTSASGTSLSTPLVGGSSGVLLSAHPNWTPVMVREALMSTADRFDTPGNDYGWGIMDVSRALYYHPQGDIVIDYQPTIFIGLNQPLFISAAITGGAGIANAFLYCKIAPSAVFTQLPMTTSDNLNFTAQIPGSMGGTIYYYIKAADNNGAFAFNPIGGSSHPFTITPAASTFSDSFDNGILYWNSGGANNFWGLTAANAHTGNLSITDSPTTDYRSNTNSYLESHFKLNLSGVASASLSFYWRGVLQSGHDSLYLEASTNGGTTWNRFSPGLTGTMNNFTQYNANLSSYLGQPNVRLRFHLTTDGSQTYEGIYIDDIQITESRPANIEYSPSALADTLSSGEIRIKSITIKNTGNSNLIVGLQAVENSMIANVADPSDPPHILNTWLFVSPSADTILSGDSLVAQVTFNASSLSEGNYTGQIRISSNDPDSALSQIPVSLRVGGQCQYVPGDANGNGSFDAVDVTYGVNYLKGRGDAPLDSCDCPPHGLIYASGDVNGSCEFNGVDITYSVNYLKGRGDAPAPCPDCPPAR